ncbi:Tuftelin-interacting protein 11 [Halotydeus destructor]|nr:Tuftelin-interacting protein 11 [Halotydeus destructor]
MDWLGGAQQFSGMASGGSGGTNIGGWEKHTKGIGAKLLLKMGYEPGKGLGKNQQGITKPIEAKKREGKGAIGFYGTEKVEKSVLEKKQHEERIEDSSDEEIAGSNTTKQVKRKVKTTYVEKSVDDVLKEALMDRVFSEPEKFIATKVIDCRGPVQKVLSNYHEMSSNHLQLRSNLTAEQQKLNETEMNLRLLVKITEKEIKRLSRHVRSEKERLEYLNDERIDYKKKIVDDQQYIDMSSNALLRLKEFRDSHEKKKMTSETFQAFCLNWKDKFPDSHARAINLNELIESIAFPLVADELSSWAPLSNPGQVLSSLSKWKNVFHRVDKKLFDILIWDIWMPRVRRELLTWPSLRHYEPVIRFLDTWKPVLPTFVNHNLISQIIVPRLEQEVEDWNPLVDAVPIHTWIHPWLPVTGKEALDTVHLIIRQKLSVALANWHPSDSSAKVILSPWRNVFSQAVWDSFLGVNIVPKLESALSSLKVTPPNQQGVEVWGWIMSWKDMLSVATVSSIFEKHFCPKWLEALYHWLGQEPDPLEILNWYLGWKAMLPSPYFDQPIIKDYFRKALEMIDHAISSPHGIRTYQFGPTMTPQMVEQIRFRHNILTSAANPSSDNLNFKQLVAKRADESGILFMPIGNKFHEGHQVHQFGEKKIIIDKDVLFVHASGKVWTPISLAALFS